MLPDWLQWISNALPASYALEALQQVGAHADLTAIAVRDIAVVIGFAVVAMCLAAATLRRQDPVTAASRKRPDARPGNSDTRDRILTSARELFARNGIDKTSIRSIAAAAGVDAALVHHYFGTKQQLFAAAIHIPIDPMQVIGPMRETPVDELGLGTAVAAAAAVGLRTGLGLHRDAAVAAGGQRRQPGPVVPAGGHHRRGRAHGSTIRRARGASGCSSSRRSWSAS